MQATNSDDVIMQENNGITPTPEFPIFDIIFININDVISDKPAQYIYEKEKREGIRPILDQLLVEGVMSIKNYYSKKDSKIQIKIHERWKMN